MQFSYDVYTRFTYQVIINATPAVDSFFVLRSVTQFYTIKVEILRGFICVCIPACMYVAYFSTFYNLLINTVWIHELIERMEEIYT